MIWRKQQNTYNIKIVSLPVPQQVEGHGARMPDSMCIKTPNKGREIPQLQCQQQIKSQHDWNPLPPERFSPYVIQAPYCPTYAIQATFWSDRQTDV